MPCVERNDDAPVVLGADVPLRFAYDGRALTLDQFRAYLVDYDFGPIPPDQLILHNTANPDASWAPLSSDARTHWDRGEAQLTVEQIKAKRKKQLDGIRDYYASMGWSSGPHLFIDERWIWLFTPMAEIGVHAKAGNSYHDETGRLHYSLGIEVVGWFGRAPWHPQQAQLLRGAVQALQATLGTFEIAYQKAPRNQPAAHQGTIAFHRDYNKAECPGAFITPQYAIPLLRAPLDELRAAQIAGADGQPRSCGSGFRAFYDARGGRSFCGFALSDETRSTDAGGRACTYMLFERVVFKHTHQFGVEQALLAEARACEWLP
jgi:hypothetical protein